MFKVSRLIEPNANFLTFANIFSKNILIMELNSRLRSESINALGILIRGVEVPTRIHTDSVLDALGIFCLLTSFCMLFMFLETGDM